ncbi:MAG TPA: class I SAM-dependent methyltransferase [Victivallales bacterium]|nr:class I SAM-dependent methyltransferase [Victivallales bacterium]
MLENRTKITIDAYNKCAPVFAKIFKNYRRYQNILVKFQNKYLNKVSSILDIGCGSGNNSKLLFDLNNNYHITGVDLSDKMIKLAKITAPHCIFDVQDIRELEFQNKFDAIISSFSIVHLTNEETIFLFQKMNELLNIGGYLYLSFMSGKKPGFETTSFSKKFFYFNYFEKDYIINKLKKSSFNILDVIKEDYRESNNTFTNEYFIFAQKNN